MNPEAKQPAPDPPSPGMVAESTWLMPIQSSVESKPGQGTVPDEPQPTPVPERMQRIGDYQVLGELGRGGMGVVYWAEDLKLKRTVALKMLWAGPDARTDELVRFRGEAEVIAQLQHPNIVQIYDIGQHEGRPYLTLEFVDGGSLDKMIQGKPQLPRLAAETIETLARAIHIAHQKGIVHRDLKPANVLITKTGTLKITDFGLAKQLGHSIGYSRTGEVMGTPSYMAPEQAIGEGRRVSPATDVYALGAILYELLTGRPPFRGVSVLETLEQVRQAEPAPPSRLVAKLPRDLSTICLKCLQKTPAKRYTTAIELADDLRRWLDGRPIHARPISSGEQLWRAIKRRPLQAALVGTSALVLVFIGLLTFQSYDRARERAYEHERQMRQEAHDQALKLEEQKHQELVQAQYDHSLRTLNDILDLVTERGPLSQQAGLEPLHKKLRQYYEELVQQQTSNGLSNPARLAEACFNLGQLISQKGRQTEARSVFEQAETLYRGLADAPEQGTDARHKLGKTLLELGKLHYNLGDPKKADEAFKSALGELQELNQTFADNLEYSADLAEVWHNLGILYGAQENLDKSLQAYKEGLELRQQLIEKKPNDPGYLRDLARSHGYLGDVYLDRGNYAEADRAYWESHRIRERLAATAKDARGPEAQKDRFQLARSWGNFAGYQTRLRDLDKAIDFDKQALTIQQALVKNNPAVIEYQTDLGNTYNRIADLMTLKKEPVESVRPFLKEAHDLYSRLYQENDDKAVSIRSGLAECHALLARLLIDHDPRSAVASLNEALPLLEVLCEQRPNPGYLYSLAMARSLASESDDKRYSPEQAVATLSKAIDKGYRGKHSLDVEQDRAFKSLRDRKDFEDLVDHYKKVTETAHSSGGVN